ncbi:glycosyltransferase, partial [Campylobacter jejuni]|nr:glycosyltransferase [Campylobacter jejuni]EAI4242945.1 glycosyltransferase [Campylobacter jejuni]ECP4056223.1 glycosyltransferase [Campylobacter jejuni]EGJ2097812.1 glycosyltransferase [Campylobacter jejuni]EKK5697321.1 glycosyltransferase [Campylobacter jejuni]
MTNVVLLGESHFAMKNGIQKGLKDSGCHVLNLSLGATPGIQNLYEIIRNRQIIQ